MKINEVRISDDFKSQVVKTKFSIFLFVVVYLILFLLAIALTALSVYAGIMLIISFPRFITIALGAGLASFGFLILIFLIKFIFKSHKIDYSHLTEVYRKDEPELFKMLDELTYKIDTDFPKKVFLSADVNASVFYDSNFWSMFFPIKKNLQIGLGLVNTVSKDELKAILSHEFGHFSQKSMKAGSFVYNVNQVIFNMLFDNESFENLSHKWASTSSYIEIFVLLAMKVIQGIQWILRKVYEIININYLALSREMEFHADEIAANVTGYKPLKNSLLRLQLADHAFNSVLSFYSEKIENSIVSKNIYREQSFVMNFLAKDDELEIINGFPLVSIHDLNKYNKSKLNVKDQWASHPSTKDRIEHLERTNLLTEQRGIEPANELFANIDATQEMITQKLFSSVETQEKPKALSFNDFVNEFEIEYSNNSLSKIYNGYYNDKNPVKIDITRPNNINESLTVQNLFSDEKVDLVYTSIALQNDIDSLTLISKKETKVKTFDYDGVKYKRKASKKLQEKLKIELEQINQKIKENDLNIFSYFKQKESGKNGAKLVGLYKNYFDYDSGFEERIDVYNELLKSLQFIQFSAGIEEIKRNFSSNKVLEAELKNNIKGFFKNNVNLTKNIKDLFELYLSKDWEYFGHEMYLDKNLEMLFKVLDYYLKTLTKEYFKHKKQLLDYQIELL